MAESAVDALIAEYADLYEMSA
ncbi:MAG: hypothetical protein JWP62_2752, partial [Blastococcus sp.]|nr:hypothetical protein [Blastococcus sp.]